MAKTTKKQNRTGGRKTTKRGGKKSKRKDIVKSHGLGVDDHPFLGEEYEQFGLNKHENKLKEDGDKKSNESIPHLHSICETIERAYVIMREGSKKISDAITALQNSTFMDLETEEKMQGYNTSYLKDIIAPLEGPTELHLPKQVSVLSTEVSRLHHITSILETYIQNSLGSTVTSKP